VRARDGKREELAIATKVTGECGEGCELGTVRGRNGDANIIVEKIATI
jgi:hypothetical protein